MKNTHHQFSKLTLRPKDAVERDLFWDFRCQDISDTLAYFVMFYVVIWIGSAFAYFIEPTSVTLTNLMLAKVGLILWIVTFLARKRFKKHFVYMIIILFIYSQISSVVSSSAFIASTPEGDELQRGMALRSGYEYLVRKATIYNILLSPHIGFTIIYLLGYCTGIASLSLLWGDMSKPQFVETLL